MLDPSKTPFNPTPERGEKWLFIGGPLDGVRTSMAGTSFEWPDEDGLIHIYEATYVKYEGKTIAHVCVHSSELKQFNSVMVIAAMQTRRVNQSIKERMLEIVEVYPEKEMPTPHQISVEPVAA